MSEQNNIGIPEQELPVEEAPMAYEGPTVDDARLAELRMMASKVGPVGPQARPGRFAARRPGAVHTIDSNVRLEDPEQEERKEAQINLYQSYLNKRILKGRVIGIHEEFDRSAPDKMKYAAVTTYGPYKVLIPMEDFADVDLEDMTRRFQKNNPDQTLAGATKVYLEHRLDAEIDFIVTRMADTGSLDDTSFVGGSRKEAMRRTRIRYWFGTQNGQDAAYLINEGDKAQARIIANARGGIRVEIFGVESFIPAAELSYSMIQDCAKIEKFSVGKKIVVRLMSINRNADDDYSVEFTASHKAALPDPRDAGLKLFQDGGIYVGTINYIVTPTAERPNRNPSVFVKLAEGVQALCPFPNGSVPPTPGAKVYVRITNHIDEKKFLFGRIQHIANFDQG